jgi:hypothetical protein
MTYSYPDKDVDEDQSADPPCTASAQAINAWSDHPLNLPSVIIPQLIHHGLETVWHVDIHEDA